MGKIDVSDQQKVFRDSIGQKATVQRETVGVDIASIPNRLLVDLGLRLQDEPKFKLETYRYLGSAAVHIYFNDTLKQLDFISQANALALYRCDELVASKALEDLIREVKSIYGRSHGKLRSGF